MASIKDQRDLKGEEVSWESQSQGTTKRKQGKCLGYLKAEESLATFMNDLALDQAERDKIRMKNASDTSELDRIIVAVPRGGQSVLSDIYTPRVGTKFMIHK